MAERFKALVLKTSVGKLTVGSNPSLSAEIKIPRVGGILILQCMSEIPVPPHGVVPMQRRRIHPVYRSISYFIEEASC